MKHINLLFILTICLFCTNVSTAQNSGLGNDVSGLFDKPNKVQWIKHYNGRLDGLHDVAITIAYDGKHCKGQLKYLRSKEVYGLAGFIKNDELRLKEINHDNQVSGFIEAKVEGDVMKGSWLKYDNSISIDLLLNESSRKRNSIGGCGNDKWIQTLNGTIDHKDVALLLQFENEGSLRGTAYFYNKNETLEMKGILGEKNKVHLEMFNDEDKLCGTLSGYLSESGIIDAGFTGVDNKQQMCSFWEQKKWSMTCLEYAEYMGSYDIVFPKTKNHAFNKWMENKTIGWTKETQQQIKSMKKTAKSLRPADRLAVQSFGWCDLNFISTTMISGTLVLDHSWEEIPEVVSFNFDLLSGKNLTAQDLFESDFEYQKFVWDFQIDRIKAHRYYSDYNFRMWLASESLETFAIQQEGIRFSTGYNPIYGQLKVTVPYEDLLPHFKKDSPIWEVANLGKVQADIRNGN